MCFHLGKRKALNHLYLKQTNKTITQWYPLLTLRMSSFLDGIQGNTGLHKWFCPFQVVLWPISSRRVHAAYIYLLKEYSTDLAAFGHTAEACSFIYNKKLSTTLEIIVMWIQYRQMMTAHLWFQDNMVFSF